MKFADKSIATGGAAWFVCLVLACNVPIPYDGWAACGAAAGFVLVMIGIVLSMPGVPRG